MLLHGAQLFLFILTGTSYETGVIIPSLQKLSLREVNELAQGHIARITTSI